MGKYRQESSPKFTAVGKGLKKGQAAQSALGELLCVEGSRGKREIMEIFVIMDCRGRFGICTEGDPITTVLDRMFKSLLLQTRKLLNFC